MALILILVKYIEMSECFSRISSEQIKRPQLTTSISISKSFIVNYFPTFNNTIKEINILKEKELALSSLEYLDHIQLTDSSDYDENELSKAFDSSLD